VSASSELALESVLDSDEAIAAALEDLSTPALIAAVVQTTGDPSLLRGPIRPRQFVINEYQGKLSEEEKATLRAQALVAICVWRDAGCPSAAPLSPEVIREALDWIACEHVPDDYAAMFQDEMDWAGAEPRRLRLTPAAKEAAGGLSAIIIGCGEAGLLSAIRLKEAGIAFEIIEKNDDVGGTWWENSYPGCRVDVASHYYSYSFAHDHDFPEYYSRQPELHRYFRSIADEHGITEHVRWHSEVERAVFDEATSRWEVSIRNADGRVETASAPILISGVGSLNRPKLPDIPGLDDFTGPAFHSARWDPDVDLTGKRVALLGAGASGFQIGPAIVDEVASLTVFQRTPQWMAPNLRYHQPVAPGERWAISQLPGYASWLRFILMWQSSDKNLEYVRGDPSWPDFPRTANELSATRREQFVGWIEQLVGDDPELLAKVTPSYPPGAKRLLLDDGTWLRCLADEKVELITDEIVAIDESAIITNEGRFEVDVIILATGFRANEVLFPMEVVGRGGQRLSEAWDGGPAAYQGVSVPDFPNLFILNGPATGLAHGGSVIFMTECQVRYVTESLRVLLEGGHTTIEPSREAYARYRDEVQAEVATLMWGHPAVGHSWYQAADGGVYVLSPWRLVDYWEMTRSIEEADHVIA
jgi:4-hydroxyacetophenone monooxygenase